MPTSSLAWTPNPLPIAAIRFKFDSKISAFPGREGN
ncbi:hypothetical protein SLEP1_g15301 [Rubroshorea leprosula]|uniref:Uncharacterized protein n=1 Tax=Rubroshorea leprosula TaxID=152421 RepID=A0AAV5ISW2_9ROSI|nr:hypothetical protein SLEP1_g15301 [Rubroshorea leprosula]